MTEPQQPRPGFVVGGRYRLDDILGEGGMAVVWKATHTETERKVALKLVRPSLAESEQARELFVKEAKIAARIGRSEHIVDVLDAGVDENLLVPFLAMELLDGEALDVRLRREGPVPRELAIEILSGLGEALDQAHGAGVIHRDLKPQNLFLTRDRKQRTVIKVLDFGIAKLAEAAMQSATQIGTPAYSAPEQLGASWQMLAEKSGKVVARTVSPGTDVWALGLVCYEMMVGASSGALWNATTLAELPVKMILEPLPSAAERAGERSHLLPPGFDGWLARCLDLDAARRFASAGEATSALVSLLGGHMSVRPPPSAVSALGPTAPVPVMSLMTVPPAPPAQTPMPQGPTPMQVQMQMQHGPTPMPAQTPMPAMMPAQTPMPMQMQAPMAQTPMPYPPPMGPGASHTMVQPGYVTTPPWIADPRIQPWLEARRFELAVTELPSIRALEPFYLMSSIGRSDRELRGAVNGVSVRILDVVPSNAIADGHALYLVVPARAVQYRAAVRSKRSTGLADDIVRGIKLLDGLMGGASPVVKTIGDPQFEVAFDVRSPTVQEGAAAIPIPLRHALFQHDFRGTIELRPGVVVVAHPTLRSFDPRELEAALAMVHALLPHLG